MGLKNKLNKMKSFLFDEEDDDYKRPSKKSSKVIKEETEEFSNTMEIEELYFEDEPAAIKHEEPIKTRLEKNEPEFKFPEFDDDDFVMVKKPEVLSPVIKEEVKPVLYQGSKRKEETKRFKPSPIISPIYGLLDNEGNTVKKDEKSKDSKFIKDEVSLEDVRKKAYGNSSHGNLENTLTRLSKKTIEEAEKDMEEEEKELRRTKKEVFDLEEDPIVVAKEEEENDDMLLPNVNFKEIDVDVEKGKKNSSVKEEIPLEKYDAEDDDDDDTKEQDLFNLIDSMYQKEGNDE